MHACNDMQIIPVDPTDLTLENIECAGDLLKDGCQWETSFFNTTTSTRRIQGKQISFVETHAIVKCNTLLNRIKRSPKVMNAMKKSQIWVKARAKGGTTTKTYIGFLMGSNPGMSSKVNLEQTLTSALQDNINDPEVFIESKKVKEFNPITKEVFDADAWHVYVNKDESREATKLLLAHLASDHQNKALGIRGCKLVPGSKNITPKSVKMYCIQE